MVRHLAIWLLLAGTVLAGEARLTALVENGARVDWSAARNLVAFDMPGDDGFCDVWTMRPDGTDRQCLSAATPGLPTAHVGQPAWHPDGTWLAIQAADPTLAEFPGGDRLAGYLASPGIGINNNIWLLAADGSEAVPVTHVRDRLGVLHPHFSPDGRYLCWAEAMAWHPGRGHQWALRLAPVSVVDGRPTVGAPKTFMPRAQRLYETHGFTPDSTRLVYSASPGATDYFKLEIYTCDLDGTHVQRLTDDAHWDEHAHVSPDGARVAWMSSRDIPQSGRTRELRTDIWLMAPDGADKERLTHFNDPTHPQAIPGGVVCGDLSWSPDGRSFVFFAILRADPALRPRGAQRTRLYRLDLPTE